ncbi:Alpha-D-kanosaminyltransferase [Phycisphaerae bacterium RAS1]|nr:Alpha-D-kanosaminyltransferase [Phycisphaerae bacterium RAS1]
MNYLVAADDCFLDRPGGMGRVAWDIAQLMRERGHLVGMVCMNHDPARFPNGLSEQNGVRIVRYQRPDLPAWHPGRMSACIEAASKAVWEHFSETSWHLVHMHTAFTGGGVFQVLGRNPRYVYTMHSPIVLENEINWAQQGIVGRIKAWMGLGKLKAAEHKVLDPATDIQTLSNFTKVQVDHFHKMGHKVRVIPHWRRPELRREMDKAEARRRLGWPLDEKILFTVRIHGPRYGIDVAIRAAAPLIQDKRCWFAIGGDGPLRPTLENLAKELGVAERTRFTGRLSDADLALAYQAADLFVLPTLSLECFGLITIEAMSFGCPVIGTDAGATPEILDKYCPGLVVPAGNVEALREKLGAYFAGRLQTPDEAATVAFIEKNYGRDVIVPKLIDLLEVQTGRRR